MRAKSIHGSFNRNVKNGNYICQDNETCKSNINLLEHLHKFVELLQK